MKFLRICKEKNSKKLEENKEYQNSLKSNEGEYLKKHNGDTLKKFEEYLSEENIKLEKENKFIESLHNKINEKINNIKSKIETEKQEEEQVQKPIHLFDSLSTTTVNQGKESKAPEVQQPQQPMVRGGK